MNKYLSNAYELTPNGYICNYTINVVVNDLKLYGGYWFAIVYRTDAEYGRIELVSYTIEGEGRICIRMMNGQFEELEWVNPRMMGIEYRTTERYNAKPVYAKLIYISQLGAAYSAVGGTLSSESIQVISLEGVATNGVLYQPFPLIRHDTTGVVIARLYVEWSTTYSCWQYYARSFDTDMSNYRRLLHIMLLNRF